MTDKPDLNQRGNHRGEFTQGVGGWAEYTVEMTAIDDTSRHDVQVPPGKLIPVIFLPGVMGSNLRMSHKRQQELQRDDNRAWRPDDLMTASGKADVLGGNGMGNWFKNASPRQRQLVFDPNETEVEYYHYTSSNERFDPDGRETLAADARHKNVPDDLAVIPPLLGHRTPFNSPPEPKKTKTTRRTTTAQIARWRGWSEILFDGAYGEMLKTTEFFLNNMVRPTQVWPHWQHSPINPMTGKPLPRLEWKYGKISEFLLGVPKTFGAASGDVIDENDIRKLSKCWYPVHAMGYNFLRSNGDSAIEIARRIRALAAGYRQRGFKCDEVIIVTHSMGGLVARALIHPEYGNMLNNNDVKILGMYHNVMPTMGAASAYKRMRFGFQEKSGFTAKIEAKIIGINGEHATAILANTEAPLELLPGVAYGKNWLKILDSSGKTLLSWPNKDEDALESIYLKSNSFWWRLINPDWINPARIADEFGGGLKNVFRRIKNAAEFLQKIEKTFHPNNCYASFCASSQQLTYGEIIFRVSPMPGQSAADLLHLSLPPPDTWRLIADDSKGTLTVLAGSKKLTLVLQKPDALGDATVPSERSARLITGTTFIHGLKNEDGYEHQESYLKPQVLASMLYSIVKIAKQAKWD